MPTELVNPTTRHWPRTTDEAFRTPAWRCPVQGPYRAPPAWRAHTHWLLLAAVLLAVLAGVVLEAWQ